MEIRKDVPQGIILPGSEETSRPKLVSRRDLFRIFGSGKADGESTPPEPEESATGIIIPSSRLFTRREVLATGAGLVLTGAAAYVGERLGLLRVPIALAETLGETGTPANPYSWIDNLGRNRVDEFLHVFSGMPPNNPDRVVDIVRGWINTDKTKPPTFIYQPWEALYQETQAGTGINLGVWGLLGDARTPKLYMWTFVTSGDGETMTFSIEVIKNNSNPTIYNTEERVRFNAGLEQRSVHIAGFRATSLGFVVDGSNSYIQMGWTNRYVPSESATYKIPLDNNGNLLPPFQEVSLKHPSLIYLPTAAKPRK